MNCRSVDYCIVANEAQLIDCWEEEGRGIYEWLRCALGVELTTQGMSQLTCLLKCDLPAVALICCVYKSPRIVVRGRALRCGLLRGFHLPRRTTP